MSYTYEDIRRLRNVFAYVRGLRVRRRVRTRVGWAFFTSVRLAHLGEGCIGGRALAALCIAGALYL